MNKLKNEYSIIFYKQFYNNFLQTKEQTSLVGLVGKGMSVLDAH